MRSSFRTVPCRHHSLCRLGIFVILIIIHIKDYLFIPTLSCETIFVNGASFHVVKKQHNNNQYTVYMDSRIHRQQQQSRRSRSTARVHALSLFAMKATVISSTSKIKSTKVANAAKNKQTRIRSKNTGSDGAIVRQPTDDMMAMSVAGIFLTLGILFILAGNGSEVSDENITRNVMVAASDDSTMKSSFTLFQERMIESLEIAGTNIVDAAVPLTASDIVSVAIGESIAGVIGASLSFAVSNLFVGIVTNQKLNTSEERSGNNNNYNNLFPTAYMSNGNGIVKMSDAMADTDYIITNVAAKEILASSLTFVSPMVRTLIATGIAIIPYSIVKFNAQKQQQKDFLRQQALAQQLMQEEEATRQQRRESIQIGNAWKQIQNSASFLWPNTGSDADNMERYMLVSSSSKVNLPLIRDTRTGMSVVSSYSSSTAVQLDWVEIFADVVKWLQFDVLCTDFGNGQLLGSATVFRRFVAESMLSQEQYVSLLIGCECAIFGIITALTSQLYSDVLYKYFKLGAVTKQESVNNRKAIDWYTIYLSKIIYCAILFGTYGALKEPTESIVMAVGSGGIDNCYGSSNFQYCIDTFVVNNPVGPTPEAQFRSLVTAAISFWNNHNQWFVSQPFSGSLYF